MENSVHPLRAFREAHQPPLTRAQLADLLEVGRPTVFRWESGSRNIDENLLSRISQRTGIPARELRPDLYEKREKLFGGGAQ